MATQIFERNELMQYFMDKLSLSLHCSPTPEENVLHCDLIPEFADDYEEVLIHLVKTVILKTMPDENKLTEEQPVYPTTLHVVFDLHENRTSDVVLTIHDDYNMLYLARVVIPGPELQITYQNLWKQPLTEPADNLSDMITDEAEEVLMAASHAIFFALFHVITDDLSETEIDFDEDTAISYQTSILPHDNADGYEEPISYNA